MDSDASPVFAMSSSTDDVQVIETTECAQADKARRQAGQREASTAGKQACLQMSSGFVLASLCKKPWVLRRLLRVK